MSRQYILNAQGEPEQCDDVMRWSRWFELDERRVVRQNTFYVGDDEVTVSTVFLGLDHGWARDKPPVLWETMVFGGAHDCEQWRHRSREEAIRVHEQVVSDLMGHNKAD